MVPLRHDPPTDPGRCRTPRIWASAAISRSSSTPGIIRPLLAFNLMLLSLPLVLGGTGAKHVREPGDVAGGRRGSFNSMTFVSQYLGGHEVYSPEMAAWAPFDPVRDRRRGPLGHDPVLSRVRVATLSDFD